MLVFCPPILAMAESGELLNEWWAPASALHPEGQPRYAYHGLLFPWLTGKLLWESSPGALQSTLAAFRGLVPVFFILGWFSLQRMLANADRAHGFAPLLGLLATLPVLGWMRLGRPEDLAALLLLGFGIGLLVVSQRYFFPLLAIAVALLAHTHPLTAVWSGLGASALAVRRFPGRAVFPAMLGTGICAVLLFLLAFGIFDTTFWEWWNGFHQMADHATFGVSGLETASLEGRLVVLGYVGLAAIPLVHALQRKVRKMAGVPVWTLVAVGLALLVVVYFGAWKPRPYNVLPFVPVAILTLLHFISRSNVSPLYALMSKFALGGLAAAGLSGLVMVSVQLGVSTAPAIPASGPHGLEVRVHPKLLFVARTTKEVATMEDFRSSQAFALLVPASTEVPNDLAVDRFPVHRPGSTFAKIPRFYRGYWLDLLTPSIRVGAPGEVEVQPGDILRD
ncbi:MAG: hypothetical protein ACFB21_14890 [Opitutales bacterium]